MNIWANVWNHIHNGVSGWTEDAFNFQYFTYSLHSTCTHLTEYQLLCSYMHVKCARLYFWECVHGFTLNLNTKARHVKINSIAAVAHNQNVNAIFRARDIFNVVWVQLIKITAYNIRMIIHSIFKNTNLRDYIIISKTASGVINYLKVISVYSVVQALSDFSFFFLSFIWQKQKIWCYNIYNWAFVQCEVPRCIRCSVSQIPCSRWTRSGICICIIWYVKC